jgi:tRNA(Ile)-lysidine synthase
LIERVQAAGLLSAGKPVVVLYSGGRDSTCLLDLAVRIAAPAAVSALHVNYGLRDAADADERHCLECCERLGVPLEVRRPRWPAASGGPAASQAAPGVGNLQAWARDQRYGAATKIARARDADVAAGHTATDQIETILYRLASSPSRRALLGMRPRQGLLVRPLLGFTREDTAAYCTERGLRWCEDETNELDAFARGRIRASLVPALKAIHPAAEENVLALAEILRDEAAVLDGLVDGVLDGALEIELTRLRELPPALRRLVVQRLADAAAGGPAPGAARRADELAGLSDHGTAALDLPHGVRAVVERGRLRLVRRTGAVGRRGTDTGQRAERAPIN